MKPTNIASGFATRETVRQKRFIEAVE